MQELGLRRVTADSIGMGTESHHLHAVALVHGVTSLLQHHVPARVIKERSGSCIQRSTTKRAMLTEENQLHTNVKVYL